MKKILAILLILCLALGCAATALAAKPTITKQPESQTVKAGGSCSFSVKVKNVNALTWYFTNPETGESYTGKQLAKAVKGVKVVNPNKSKITLKKVPEEMHGWSVHCKISANGYSLESDTVLLLIEGMDAPTSAAAEEPTASEPTVEEVTGIPAETESESVAEPLSDPVAEPIAPDFITVTVEGAAVQEAGSSDEPATSLSLSAPASVIITANGTVGEWVINGISFIPDAIVSEIALSNLTGNMSIVAKPFIVEDTSAAEEDIDEPEPEATPEPVIDYGNMLPVSCENCYFSGGDYNRETEGTVPSGTVIRVTAGRKGDITAGYSVNGGAYEHANEASFEMVVTEPTTVTMP